MELKVFGIRHHGPGSSRSLIKALHLFKPDILLVEGAPELDKILSYTQNNTLIPPVAALLYNPNNLKQAVYYPFAEFSPEWQAYRYAHAHNIALRHLDLPQALSFGLEEVPDKLSAPKEQQSTQNKLFSKDPLGYMAALAGYSDSERWWEFMFEHGQNNSDVFESILDMMSALRQETTEEGAAINLIREAYMRKILRKAIKDGFQKIAIVCGAWHGPVLKDYQSFKVSQDNALLKGIPKVPVKSTWIAWTYERIARSSGYGAGVVSPAWYDLLFRGSDSASIHWMAKVAQLFQELDIMTSSAHAIEAVRLAETLAALRGLPVPGIVELKEAVQTIFSGGSTHQLELINDRLIVGTKMGQIPDAIPLIPLQQDIDKAIKKLKLSKYKKPKESWIKATASKPKGGLDLRLEHDRNQSHFLHRLSMLGIEWGRIDRATGRELSTKNEYWKMHWNPDFNIRIIEAGMWGNSLEAAALHYIAHKSFTESLTIVELTTLLQKVLHANLPTAMQQLVQQLREQAAVVQDISHLMQIVPSLVHVYRYGDVRNTSVHLVYSLFKEILPRICIALSTAAVALDESSERQFFNDMLQVNRALSLLDDSEYINRWQESLYKLSQLERTAGLVRGFAARVVFDSGLFNTAQMTEMMAFALSPAVKVQTACAWLEGYLYGSALLLIHNPPLWQIVDNWLNELNNPQFKEMLPLLRKTFATFSEAERAKIYALIEHGKVSMSVQKEAELHPERLQNILPQIKLIFNS